MIDGPNPCAVYIRAGWSLGNTQDRYIIGGQGEDELCGRLLAGHTMESSKFAVLPPHFSTEGLERLHSVGMGRFIDNYDSYGVGLQRAMPFFLASILYHIDTLRSWFPIDHPVWAIKLFRSENVEILESLRRCVLLGEFKCPDSGLRATGIPGIAINIIIIIIYYHSSYCIDRYYWTAQALR